MVFGFLCLAFNNGFIIQYMGFNIAANVANVTVYYPIAMPSYPCGACVSGGSRSFYSANLSQDKMHINAGYWLSNAGIAGSANAPATYIFAMIFGFI